MTHSHRWRLEEVSQQVGGLVNGSCACGATKKHLAFDLVEVDGRDILRKRAIGRRPMRQKPHVARRSDVR